MWKSRGPPGRRPGCTAGGVLIACVGQLIRHPVWLYVGDPGTGVVGNDVRVSGLATEWRSGLQWALDMLSVTCL